MKKLFIDILNDEQIPEMGLSEIVGGESAPTCPGSPCNVYTQCPYNGDSCPGNSLVCKTNSGTCKTNVIAD